MFQQQLGADLTLLSDGNNNEQLSINLATVPAEGVLFRVLHKCVAVVFHNIKPLNLMKFITFSVLLFLTINSVGQSRSELADSKVYVCGTYKNEKNNSIALETKTALKDTTINNIVFSKFTTERFIDYSKQRTSNLFFETFNDSIYILLDKNLKIIHRINYSTTKPQTATIFGKTDTVDLEFIDTRNSFPRDSLIPTDKTPRKYYLKSNDEIYLVIIPDIKTLAVSSNGVFYTKQLFGDNYNQISNSIKNDNSISNQFKIQNR